MFQRKFLLALVLPALMSSTALAQAQTSHREYDEIAWKEMRAAKRDQVRELCELWIPTWRPGTVGATYINLAERYANIDTSGCSRAVKRHLKNADRINTEIGETFALGMPDIKTVLLLTPYGAGGAEMDTSVTSQRGVRVMELMREMAESEKRLIAEIGVAE